MDIHGYFYFSIGIYCHAKKIKNKLQMLVLMSFLRIQFFVLGIKCLVKPGSM